MDYKIGTNYNGFVLVREENIKEAEASYLQLHKCRTQHKVSGNIHTSDH